jgi:hypothetical protein
MPIKSMAQLRAMYAAAEGRGESDIPKKVAKKFIKETPKSEMKDLPEKVKGKRKDGYK